MSDGTAAFKDGFVANPCLQTMGAVLSDQIKSLSWTDRNAEYIEAASPQVLAEARAKAKALSGL